MFRGVTLMSRGVGGGLVAWKGSEQWCESATISISEIRRLILISFTTTTTTNAIIRRPQQLWRLHRRRQRRRFR